MILLLIKDGKSPVTWMQLEIKGHDHVRLWMAYFDIKRVLQMHCVLVLSCERYDLDYVVVKHHYYVFAICADEARIWCFSFGPIDIWNVSLRLHNEPIIDSISVEYAVKVGGEHEEHVSWAIILDHFIRRGRLSYHHWGLFESTRFLRLAWSNCLFDDKRWGWHSQYIYNLLIYRNFKHRL